MKITVVGSGYVGLVSGACFADYGHYVICVDQDAKKIENLNNNIIPIYEPGLKELVEKNVKSNRLSFSTDLKSSMKDSDTVFIAVGTPSRRGDGHADLSFLYEAAKEIANHIKKYTVIVTKSTVPVGTGDEVEKIISKTNPSALFSVVSNPEFLREGAAINDFKKPDRIVIGVNDDQAKEVMKEVYRPLSKDYPLVFMSRRSSELSKYSANAFLAMKISFINEIADLCEKTGARISDVSNAIGLDNRIGAKFLQAGPGYGGSCFPKDSLALAKTAEDFKCNLELVQTTIKVNDNRKEKMANRIYDILGTDNLEKRQIGILGLTFKPNTDDMRDSPSIDIINSLLKRNVKIRAYDPKGMNEAKKIFSEKEITYCLDAYDALKDCDLAVLITEWEEFRALDLDKIGEILKEKNFLDLRNIYTKVEASKSALNYYNIGND